MLMDRYQAKAIFDETSVLLADQSLNITEAVIAEIDAHGAEAAPEAAPRRAGARAGREDRRRKLRWHWRSTRTCRRPTSSRSSG